jgi:hypothetical protein
LPEVDGGFKTVLADPPWRFTNRTGKVAPEHRRLDRYSTLDLDAICELPVASVLADNAHHVPVGAERAAPGRPSGDGRLGLPLCLQRDLGQAPQGRRAGRARVGFYFRNVTEIILFGLRGSMRTLAPARRQVDMIESRKREHSRKPDEQYDLIEACSPGAYLELFARHAHEGLDGVGRPPTPT